MYVPTKSDASNYIFIPDFRNVYGNRPVKKRVRRAYLYNRHYAIERYCLR